MPDPVVVLIEDEPQIRKFLRATLEGQGYRLFEATSGADGVVEVGSRQPDVVIVDLGLPDMDGLDVIRRVREWTDVPVIVLSARGGERDKVTALDAGADDYVSKPFGRQELLARVGALLRRAGAGAGRRDAEQRYEDSFLSIDYRSRLVTVGDRVEVCLHRVGPCGHLAQRQRGGKNFDQNGVHRPDVVRAGAAS